MRPWSFPVALEPDSGEPRFLQIARAVAADIRGGRLKPGAALPGSRSLAETLGVHRNTVLAAYRELEAEGWIASGHRSTRVAEDLPAAARSGRGASAHAGPGFAFEALPLALPPETKGGVLHMAGGLPDLRLVPADLLARAYRRALRAKDAPLGYGDPRGHARLRAALAGLLAEMRGLSCGEEQLLLTSGSQMAIDLVARCLLRPGDVVAVEDPGYPPIWGTLRAAGAEVVPLPVDAAGLSVDALEALAEKRPVRAVYLTPHHQFPTTATMSAPRRLRLLELARRRRIAVLEDDYDFEFHYEGRPVLPLASADPAGVVIYVGSLSKVLAPSLRLGFVAGPRAFVETLAARRMMQDRQGDQVLERAVAELIEDGLLQRHGRKMRRAYLERRDVLAEALRRQLPGRLDFAVPPGGMSLWTRVEAGEAEAAAWARRCAEQGAQFHRGGAFDFRKRELPFFRLGFSTLNPRELREAVRRMAAALG